MDIQQPSRSPVSELTAETQGQVLYQEQVMHVLHRMGEIPLAEGYEFVKQAAKRKDVAAYRERFRTTAVKKKFSVAEVEVLFDELELAAANSVCKANQLANGLTTWQSAYLKTHFPREFQQAIEQIGIGSD